MISILFLCFNFIIISYGADTENGIKRDQMNWDRTARVFWFEFSFSFVLDFYLGWAK